MSGDALTISGLNFRYREDLALEDVSLNVRAGEFLVLLGPNGGGKTTLLKLILGLLKPLSGEIQLFGEKHTDALARVGYVPQHTNVQPGFPVTVEQVVLMGLPRRSSWRLRYSQAEKKQAHDALEKVDVGHLRDKRMEALSGGQRQRVLIARALIGKPDLLIFDEPTSNIDPHGTYCFYEMLSTLGDGLSIVLVSHDFSITAPMINSVACVNKQLIYNPEPALTPEMLSLMYGVHPHSCPMGCYLHDLSHFVMNHQHHVDH